MWTTDQGRCTQCAAQKAGTCPDAKIINKRLRELQDEIDNNEGGPSVGMIIVVCNDTDMQTGAVSE